MKNLKVVKQGIRLAWLDQSFIVGIGSDSDGSEVNDCDIQFAPTTNFGYCRIGLRCGDPSRAC